MAGQQALAVRAKGSGLQKAPPVSAAWRCKPAYCSVLACTLAEKIKTGVHGAEMKKTGGA